MMRWNLLSTVGRRYGTCVTVNLCWRHCCERGAQQNTDRCVDIGESSGTYTMLVELKRKNNSTSEARSKRDVHPGYFGIPADEQ
jgi:hypothetical protein